MFYTCNTSQFGLAVFQVVHCHLCHLGQHSFNDPVNAYHVSDPSEQLYVRLFIQSSQSPLRDSNSINEKTRSLRLYSLHKSTQLVSHRSAKWTLDVSDPGALNH